MIEPNVEAATPILLAKTSDSGPEDFETNRRNVQSSATYGEEEPHITTSTPSPRTRRTSSSTSTRPPLLQFSTVSDQATDSVGSRSDDQHNLQDEARYYNSRALQRAVIGEAFRGSTRDWSVVDVPPGTYSVTLDGIGGGSQVITWQIHNGARQSRFVADDQEFTAWAEFGAALHVEHADGRAGEADPLPSTLVIPRDLATHKIFERQSSLSRSSLEDLLAVSAREDAATRDADLHRLSDHQSQAIGAADKPLPASPDPTQDPRSDSTDDGPELHDVVQDLRTVRIATPELAEDKNVITTDSPDPAAPSVNGSHHRPEPSISNHNDLGSKSVYADIRSQRPVRYGTGADFSSSESELNPEDSISRIMRPNSASDHHRSTLGTFRIRGSNLGLQKFDFQSEYEGIIFYIPDHPYSIAELDHTLWDHVRRLQMPLQSREIYDEAVQRADAASALDQFLALPSDFLRERVDEEIALRHGSTSGNEETLMLRWSLLGACIEDNKLMLFLRGLPLTTGALDSHLVITHTGSDDDHLSSAPASRNRGRSQDRPNRTVLLTPRSIVSPEPTGPGASVEDLVSTSGPPSAVSAYRPSVRMANRYPVSTRRREKTPARLSVRAPSTDSAHRSTPVDVANSKYKRGASRPDPDVESPIRGSQSAKAAAGRQLRQAGRSDHTLDGSEPDVQLLDVIGRRFSFPWRFVKTYAGIQDLIGTAFVHIDSLQPEVSKGHYDLLGPGDRVILPKLWEELVKPGWELTMKMWSTPVHVKSPPYEPASRQIPFAGATRHNAPAVNPAHLQPLSPSPTTMSRVDSLGSKYVLETQSPTTPAFSNTRSSYLGDVAALQGELPHLTNTLATGCRNPNGGRVFCWDTLRVGERPVLVKQAGASDWDVGGNLSMTETLGLPTADVRLRTIIVEDLTPELIEWIGASLWLNPEFFEEHLSRSCYQGAACREPLPQTWNTNITTKDYISVKWHRPVECNDLGPRTAQERHALLDLEGGLQGLMLEDNKENMTDAEVESLEDLNHAWAAASNIFRPCWTLASRLSSHATSGALTPAVWEERATLHLTRMSSCPTVVLLIDPIPRLCRLIPGQGLETSASRPQLLYRQLYNRNSVGSVAGSAGSVAADRPPARGLIPLESHKTSTNSTAADILHWLDEAIRLTPDNPDLSIVTGLLWVIHRDTIGFMHLVSNILEEIGLGSTNDTMVRTNLSHWRELISRFQVELPALRTSLDLFASFAQDIAPVGPAQSIVSEFIPETLVQIDILIEQNEKSYAALRADMGVLESRKAIAEAESVGKLTELAFVFIPLTFITGAFSMQIEELQTPAPVWAFIIAALVAITLAYSARLAMRSDFINGWARSYLQRITESGTSAESDHVRLPWMQRTPLRNAMRKLRPRKMKMFSPNRAQKRQWSRSGNEIAAGPDNFEMIDV